MGNVPYPLVGLERLTGAPGDISVHPQVPQEGWRLAGSEEDRDQCGGRWSPQDGAGDGKTRTGCPEPFSRAAGEGGF